MSISILFMQQNKDQHGDNPKLPPYPHRDHHRDHHHDKLSHAALGSFSEQEGLVGMDMEGTMEEQDFQCRHFTIQKPEQQKASQDLGEKRKVGGQHSGDDEDPFSGPIIKRRRLSGDTTASVSRNLNVNVASTAPSNPKIFSTHSSQDDGATGATLPLRRNMIYRLAGDGAAGRHLPSSLLKKTMTEGALFTNDITFRSNANPFGRSVMHDLESEGRHPHSYLLTMTEDGTVSPGYSTFNSNAEESKQKVTDGSSDDLVSNNEPTEAASTLLWRKHISSESTFYKNTSSMLQAFDATDGGGVSTLTTVGEESDLQRPASSQHFSAPSTHANGKTVSTNVSVTSIGGSFLQQQWPQQPPRQLTQKPHDALNDLIMKVEAGPNNFLLRRKNQSTSRTTNDPLKTYFAYSDPVRTSETLVSSMPQHQGAPSAGRLASFPSSPQHERNDTQSHDVGGEQLILPPIADWDRSLHYGARFIMSMATAEDANWLSDLQCFIRAEMLEVFRVGELTPADHHPRRKLFPGQVGIRCRFCAHLPKDSRVVRSSAFPSKISKIYQSFVMINRDHFSACREVPPEIYNKFSELKDTKPPVRANVKNYWENSAQKLGFVDTGPEQGICVNEGSIANAAALKPFCSEEHEDDDSSSTPVKFLVNNNDRDVLLDGASEYIFTLMLQTQVIHMTQEELKQKENGRQTIPKKETGFGCRYCCKQGWMGGSRFFPTSFNNLRKCMDDLHHHVQRCSLCPSSVKHKLAEELKHQQGNQGICWSVAPAVPDRNTSAPRQQHSNTLRPKLLDIIWTRLAAAATDNVNTKRVDHDDIQNQP